MIEEQSEERFMLESEKRRCTLLGIELREDKDD
jgi:hypothetical protein